MRQLLRRALPTAVVVVLLAGCAAERRPRPGLPRYRRTGGRRPGRLPDHGVSDTGIDQFARNALTDLERVLVRGLSGVLRRGLHPLENGYFSVDSNDIDEGAYPDTGIGCDGSPTDPGRVAGNAFYDPSCDLIAYDRALLEELSTDYGRFLGPVVMAHEFGHAMQGRFGFATAGGASRTRPRPTASPAPGPRGSPTGNADARLAAHPRARRRHPRLPAPARRRRQRPRRQPGARVLLRPRLGLLRGLRRRGRLRAATTSATTGCSRPPPSRTTATSTRGQRGLRRHHRLGRRRRCRSSGPRSSRPPSTSDFDAARRSRASTGLRRTARASRTATSATAPTTTPSTSTRPTWPRRPTTRSATSRSPTALSLPYSLAVRDQAGLSIDDGAATRSAVCLTGWYEAQWFNGAFNDATRAAISPGDIDEAVQFLLEYGVRPRSSRTRRRPASSWSGPSAPASCRAATPATSAAEGIRTGRG